MSWCKKDDNSCDVRAYGVGTKRLCILDTLLAHTFTEETRVHWSSTVTDANVEWKGRYCTADHIKHYFVTRLINLIGPGGILFLDNASIHKSYLKKLYQSSEQDIVDFITEAGFNTAEFEAAYADLQQTVGSGRSRRAWLIRWVREHSVQPHELEQMAEDVGIKVIYLPPYCFETDPQEYVWGRLKNEYRRIDIKLPPEERLQAAYTKIDSDFSAACLSRTIKWCRQQHEKFEAQPAAPELDPSLSGVCVVGDSDDNTSDCSDMSL